MDRTDPPLLRATGPGGPFSYTSEGPPAGDDEDRAVVVAIHGVPGSVRDYRYLGAGLAPRARLVRLDMPGFGATPAASAAGVTVDARAAFVLAALEALGIGRCVLVGHSMGGPVAAAAAAAAPARVVGLALLASVGLRPHRLLRRALLRGPMGRAVDRPLVGGLARRAAHRLLRLAGFPASTPAAEAAQAMRVLGAFDFAPMLAATRALRAPTLTAFADDDPFIEPAIAEELGRAAPAGPRLRWAAGGHNIQKSHAAELAAALLTMP